MTRPTPIREGLLGRSGSSGTPEGAQRHGAARARPDRKSVWDVQAFLRPTPDALARPGQSRPAGQAHRNGLQLAANLAPDHRRGGVRVTLGVCSPPGEASRSGRIRSDGALDGHQWCPRDKTARNPGRPTSHPRTGLITCDAAAGAEENEAPLGRSAGDLGNVVRAIHSEALMRTQHPTPVPPPRPVPPGPIPSPAPRPPPSPPPVN